MSDSSNSQTNQENQVSHSPDDPKLDKDKKIEGPGDYKDLFEGIESEADLLTDDDLANVITKDS